MKSFDIFMGGFCCGAMLTGLLLLSSDTEDSLKQGAIKRGVARYNPTTGKWEWTVPLTDAEAIKIKNYKEEGEKP